MGLFPVPSHTSPPEYGGNKKKAVWLYFEIGTVTLIYASDAKFYCLGVLKDAETESVDKKLYELFHCWKFY